MKNKLTKFLQLLLVLFVISPLNIKAEEASTELTYTVPESYTFTVSSAVNLSEEVKTGNISVNVTNVLLKLNNQIEITVSSPNYNEGWRAIYDTSYISYNIKNDGNDVENNSVVLQAPYNGGNKSVTLNISTSGEDNNTNYANPHTDTLIFTASIVSGGN